MLFAPCIGACLSEKEPPLKKWILALIALVAFSDLAAAQSWTGRASYYALRGRTASGAHVGEFTAAHRTLPFGSKVKVTNLHNNRSVVVVINDRGPFTRGRVIDVSARAADTLGFRVAGVTTVKVETVAQ
jgi:rare lipoprotein A